MPCGAQAGGRRPLWSVPRPSRGSSMGKSRRQEEVGMRAVGWFADTAAALMAPAPIPLAVASAGTGSAGRWILAAVLVVGWGLYGVGSLARTRPGRNAGRGRPQLTPLRRHPPLQGGFCRGPEAR